jgi:cytochrome c-type biogenesis protein
MASPALPSRPGHAAEERMSDLVSQAPLAFAAGLVSFLSPCVMPMLPAYLSLVSGLSLDEIRAEGAIDQGLRRRVLVACAGFIAGFSVVFVAMGIGAVAIGHVVRTWRLAVFGLEIGIAQLAGLAIALFGLHMTGLFQIAALNRDTRPLLGGKQRSVWTTLLVGAGFALGWSPCIGPILSGVLALAASGETAGRGAALLALYSAGLAVPFFLAGWSIEFFLRTFGRMRAHLRTVEIVAGSVLVLVGGLLVFDQLSRLNELLSFLNDWVVAIEEALL